MKEIKLVRMSSYPVEPEDLEKHHEEFKVLFDKAKAKCEPDMLRLQKLLSRLEKSLNSKYPNVINVPFAKTKKACMELMDSYGNIMMGKHAETGELVYVIMDEQM